MWITSKKTGTKQIGNWQIDLTENELLNYGLRYGYTSRNVYAVTTKIADGAEGTIWAGYHGSTYAKRNNINYTVKIELDATLPDPNNWTWVVYYKLVNRTVNGDTVTYPQTDEQPTYLYRIKAGGEKDTLRKFLRELLKDGVLAFGPQSAAAEPQQPATAETQQLAAAEQQQAS